MNILSTPRGVIMVSHSKGEIAKARKAWPSNEPTFVNEWADPKKKTTSRRTRRVEDAPDA